jgi:glycosyltransferase involved in cell wall biosynthesis
MHIAWLGKKSPFCGNVTYGREVTNALLDRGHRVSFLHFTQEQSLVEDISEVQEVPLPFLYKSQVYTIPTLRSSKILAESLRELKPDLVHASLTLSPLDFLLPEICEELNVPLVATFHPAFGRKRRNLTAGTQHFMYQLYAPFLTNYDRVIVFSQLQLRLLEKLGVPTERLVVIPNGVDIDKYAPGPSNFKAEVKAEHLFIYLGRIAAEKNVESLLRAWRQVDLPPGSKLVIVGDGPLAAALKPTYGPEYNILWLGAIADETRRIQMLRGADAFILPSFVEGLSLALLEAMACGCACLATDAGADAEALEGGSGIILHPERVRSQLRTLLPVLCEQPELVTILGQKARLRVLQRYSLKGNLDQLEQLYVQVLQQPKVPLKPLFPADFNLQGRS